VPDEPVRVARAVKARCIEHPRGLCRFCRNGAASSRARVTTTARAIGTGSSALLRERSSHRRDGQSKAGRQKFSSLDAHGSPLEDVDTPRGRAGGVSTRTYNIGSRHALPMRETRKTLATSDISSDIEPVQAATTSNRKQAAEEAIPGQRVTVEKSIRASFCVC